MFSFQAVQILIFLIPGFIASRMLGALIVRKKEQTEIEAIVEALIFTMLIYTAFSFLGLNSPVGLNQTTSTIIFPEPLSFLWLITLSIIMPGFFASIINRDWHMALARDLRITKKTSRLSVWNDALSTKRPLVVIDFADGRRLFGWVEHFSDYPENPFLYIASPQWIDKDGKYIDIGLDGMLITPEQKISFIEFLKDDNQQDKQETKNGTK